MGRMRPEKSDFLSTQYVTHPRLRSLTFLFNNLCSSVFICGEFQIPPRCFSSE